jgi:ribonuclease Z
MRPSFDPRLTNGPFDDPGLYIPFIYQNRAMLFDLGDLTAVTPRELLKVSHAFVTHTHMDHFIGFDRLLRLNLGRERSLHVFGPAGFLHNVEGKLAGYTWNLVENYDQSLTLTATELRAGQLLTASYPCRQRFRRQSDPDVRPFRGALYEEPGLSVSAVELAHGIPCLGFSLEERFHVNIRRDGLSALGLEPGPWLQDFKQALYTDAAPRTLIAAERIDGGGPAEFHLADLAREIALITPGQKISYIVDTGFSRAKAADVVNFVKGADQLYIEAAFLDEDAEAARVKRHLTARQAGLIAGWAGVGNFHVFHFSPRYMQRSAELRAEAERAYQDALRRAGPKNEGAE